MVEKFEPGPPVPEDLDSFDKEVSERLDLPEAQAEAAVVEFFAFRQAIARVAEEDTGIPYNWAKEELEKLKVDLGSNYEAVVKAEQILSEAEDRFYEIKAEVLDGERELTITSEDYEEGVRRYEEMERKFTNFPPIVDIVPKAIWRLVKSSFAFTSKGIKELQRRKKRNQPGRTV